MPHPSMHLGGFLGGSPDQSTYMCSVSLMTRVTPGLCLDGGGGSGGGLGGVPGEGDSCEIQNTGGGRSGWMNTK